MKPKMKSRFINVKCPKCNNEQVIFSKASSEVKCLICNHALAAPKGGKARIKGKVLELLN
jgi:small subunit ribosomal protein S27e